MKKMIALTLVLLLILAASPALAGRSGESYTPIKDTSGAMLNNLDLCISLVDATFVGYGETFSFLDTTGPKTYERGYVDAVNGRGAKVVGGGISHVATTLYLQIKALAPSLKVSEKHVFSKFTGGYVKDKDDAIAVDYNDGLDLCFKNNWQDLMIYMWRDGEGMYCLIEAAPMGDGDSDYTHSDGYLSGVPAFDYDGISASLNQNMATRTGPNTKYTEPGTFPRSTDIEVFYKTEGNGVMWGMVEFKKDGEWYRLYTGMKRIDAARVPEDEEDYQMMTLTSAVTPRYGPGQEYAPQPDKMPSGGSVKVFFQENGYVMVDYEGKKQTIRGWVSADCLEW